MKVDTRVSPLAPTMTDDRREWLDGLKVGDKVLVSCSRQTPGSRNTGYVDNVAKAYFVVFGYRFSRRSGHEIGVSKKECQQWIDKP